MTRVAWCFCAVLAVILGCEDVTSVTDSGSPDGTPDSGSPELQPEVNSRSFECDLGVLPEDVRRVGSAVFYAGATVKVPNAGDLIAFGDDRLYVLSERGFLALVNSSDLDHLVLLGRHRLPYTPFKLIPRGNTLWVLSTAARSIEGMGNSGVSHAIALDVSDPSAIRELVRVEIPGVIDDAQLAGDLLYVVSNEYPGFRDPTPSAPPTVVSAIALDDTSATRPRSQVRFAEAKEQWTNSNVMLLSEQRIYVAGPQWTDSGPVGSTIHVVDIAAQDGALRVASELQVAGAVAYSWQLDEREGVLRVVSIDAAVSTDPLVLQTFAVRASDRFEPLGQLALPLTSPRDPLVELGGRFAGTRAFLAAVGGGTLLTVDLSDPSAPKQVGRSELGGSLSYLEVRGERLFALAPGSLTLLDVSNLAAPALRSKVLFPGVPMLGNLNLSPQALEFSADGRLLVIPYSASELAPRWECHGRNAGGVQLISIAGDQLSLRGLAGSAGQPRRAIVRDDRVISVGNQHVESYLDTSQLRSRLTIHQDVTFVAQLSDGVLARVTQPEDNIAPQLELVTDRQLEDPSQSLGGLSLLDALTTDRDQRCQLQFRVQSVSARESMLYVAFETFQAAGRSLGVLAIDASDPSAPRLAGKLDWSASEWFEPNYAELSYLSLPIYVWSGSTLLMLEHTNAGDQRLRVVDLSNASEPHAELVPLARDRYVQLRASGERVLASRYERQSGTRVRFFVDSIDISDPRAPRMISAVNTPGAVLSLDPETGRGLSYCWHHAPQQTSACVEYETSKRTCLALHETLQLIELKDDGALELDRSELPVDHHIRASGRGTSAHFLALSSSDGPASLLAVPANARNIVGEQSLLDLAPTGLTGPLQLSVQAERAFVSNAQNAAWVAYRNGTLEIEQPYRLSDPIQQVDVSPRGAALALGLVGAQWLAAPE